MSLPLLILQGLKGEFSDAGDHPIKLGGKRISVFQTRAKSTESEGKRKLPWGVLPPILIQDKGRKEPCADHQSLAPA